MPTPPASLLHQLNDGHWHTGTALAAQLKVSRAAIHARITQLRDMGVEIHAVRAKGYRLSQVLTLLDAPAIQAQISPILQTQVTVREVVTSTNTLLMDAPGQAGIHVLFAEYQSAGRGRLGRTWHAPLGSQLLCSASLDLPRAPMDLGTISLAAGAAVTQWLRTLGVPAWVKWPNDIWLFNEVGDPQKLAGILCESRLLHQGDMSSACRVVVGVGLNVTPMTSLPFATSSTTPPAMASTAVQVTAPQLTRQALAVGLAQTLALMLTQFADSGFSGFIAPYRTVDALKDKALTLWRETGQTWQILHGIGQGIADDGALCVDIDGTSTHFTSGEVTVRL